MIPGIYEIKHQEGTKMTLPQKIANSPILTQIFPSPAMATALVPDVTTRMMVGGDTCYKDPLHLSGYSPQIER